MGRAERGRDIVEVRHGAHVDPGLRHRDHHIGVAEAELVEQHHARIDVRNGLADLVLAGDAEMHAALRQLRGDVGGREVGDLDAGHAGDRAAIFARAARLHQLEAGAREELLGIFLQPPLGRHREHERRAHDTLPIWVRRSIHTANPTAGIGSLAPSRVSSPS
jgi:hypothetical protein